MSALIEQAPGQSERIMEVLNHSRTVNDALEEVPGSRIVRMRALQHARTFTPELADLLDKLKKDDEQMSNRGGAMETMYRGLQAFWKTTIAVNRAIHSVKERHIFYACPYSSCVNCFS